MLRRTRPSQVPEAPVVPVPKPPVALVRRVGIGAAKVDLDVRGPEGPDGVAEVARVVVSKRKISETMVLPID